MTMMELYWLTRLPALGSFFGSIAIVALIILPFFAAIAGKAVIEDDMTSQTYKRWTLGLIAGILGFGLLNVAAPDERSIAIILTGYYVTNNEEIKKLPDNVIGSINTLLEGFQGKIDEKGKPDETDAKSHR
jgi:hypothetical protein